MSILTYPLGFIGGGKEFYNGVMENSLRFNDDDSAVLKHTPEAAGNRELWSWSGWVKRSTVTGYQVLFGQGDTGSSSQTSIWFDGSPDNIIGLYWGGSGGPAHRISARLR